jgi:hypothetical protein
VGLVVLVYFVLSVSVGGGMIWHGHTWPGIALIIGSIICFMAGSGARGARYMGQRRSALAIGAVLLLIGAGLVFFTDPNMIVSFFGFEITGDTWAGIGAVVGWFAAKPEHAGVTSEEIAEPSSAR